MNDEQSHSDGDRRNGDQGTDLTRPFAPLNPPTRPQQRAPHQAAQSALWTQRREHPGGPPSAQGSAWSPPSPAPQQRGTYPGSPSRSGAGGAFAAALIATLVVVGVSIGSSYMATHAGWASSSARQHLYNAGLAVWPRSFGVTDSSDTARSVLNFGTSSYVVAFAVAGSVLLLLLWAAIASVPGGRGAFSVFLAGWGATVVAGAAAATVEFAIASSNLPIFRLINSAFEAGGLWAVHVGWVVGLVAAIGQSVRSKRS